MLTIPILVEPSIFEKNATVVELILVTAGEDMLVVIAHKYVDVLFKSYMRKVVNPNMPTIA